MEAFKNLYIAAAKLFDKLHNDLSKICYHYTNLEVFMDLGLRDKRAFIAGSSRGLGFAAALTLAREGCKVAVNSREKKNAKASAKRIAKETGTQAFGCAGDVTKATNAEALIA